MITPKEDVITAEQRALYFPALTEMISEDIDMLAFFAKIMRDREGMVFRYKQAYKREESVNLP